MCGNDNYCEIVCQLFQASLLLMDSAVVCCETSNVLIHIQEVLGGPYREYLVSYNNLCGGDVPHIWPILIPLLL
jgi:hypothetical protein